MNWSDLKLAPSILQLLATTKYSKPLLVQRQVIPAAMRFEELAVCSETGSGKTLAFAIPVLQMLQRSANNPEQTLALIISPTKMLAAQIADVFRELGVEPGLYVGGVNDKSGRVVIATPGRLCFSLIQKSINIADLKILIVDEADKTCQMPETEQCFKMLPKQRQNLVFSATIDKSSEFLRAISQRFEFVNCEDDFVVPVNLRCWYVCIPVEQKIYWLARYICSQPLKIVVFTLTCAFSKFLHCVLSQVIPDRKLFYLHGKQNANQQARNYEQFLESETAVLITTDVAARGLDVDSLGIVIQFDPPKCLETFIHRAGRTARNGKLGEAGVFLTKNEVGIIQILKSRGVAIDLQETSEIVQSDNPLLSQEMCWEELEHNSAQIRALKKQLKKLNQSVQIQISKGVKEEIAVKQFSKAIQSLEQQLQPLLDQEQNVFATQNLVKEHPLTLMMQQMQIDDRYMLDMAQQALASYLRAYAEYELKILLNLKNLRIGPLAMSMGLLALPNIAELKQFYVNFKTWEGDLNCIKYLDQKMEAERIRRGAEKKERTQKQLEADLDAALNNEEPAHVAEAKPASKKLLSREEKKQKEPKREPAMRAEAINDAAFNKEKQLLMRLEAGEIDEDEFERLLE